MRLAPLTLALSLSLAAVPAALAQDAPNTSAGMGTPISLEQTMADPDWIGPPVEQFWWSWDGARAQYQLKREGESIRDMFEVPVSGGTSRKVDGADRAQLDAANPVFVARERHARALRIEHRVGGIELRAIGAVDLA